MQTHLLTHNADGHVKCDNFTAHQDLRPAFISEHHANGIGTYGFWCQECYGARLVREREIETMTVHPSIIEANKTKRRNAILCAATEMGFPRHHANDLYIECRHLTELPEPATRLFGLILRENGADMAYNAFSAASARCCVDSDDIQAFFLYKATVTPYGTEEGEAVRVSKLTFLSFLSDLENEEHARAEAQEKSSAQAG